jgi:hypothetical protein
LAAEWPSRKSRWTGAVVVTLLAILLTEEIRERFDVLNPLALTLNAALRDRVFPIVLDDANFYDASGRLDHIPHCENQKVELEAKAKKVGGERLKSIHTEIDLFAEFRATINASRKPSPT